MVHLKTMFDIDEGLGKGINYPLYSLSWQRTSWALCSLTPSHLECFIVSSLEILGRSAICNTRMISSFSRRVGKRVFGSLSSFFIFQRNVGLTINFHKTCLYTTNFDSLSNQADLLTLNYMPRSLPFTYLGIPIMGRRPRK